MSRAEERANEVYKDHPVWKVLYQEGYEQALEDLLDVAIECEVFDDWQYGKDADHKTQPAIKLRCPELKIGQKVKVIIIKE